MEQRWNWYNFCCVWRKGQVFNLPEASFFFKRFFFVFVSQELLTLLMSVLSWVEGCLHRSSQLPWYLKSYMDFFSFFLNHSQSSFFSCQMIFPFPFSLAWLPFPFFFQHFTLIRREIFWVGIYSVEVRCFSFFTSISSGFNLLGYSTTFVILYVGTCKIHKTINHKNTRGESLFWLISAYPVKILTSTSVLQ